MCRNFVISGLSTALVMTFSGSASAAQPVDVQAMTVVDSEGGTRAFVDVPKGTSYEVFALANPNRLVLDLHNSRLAADFHLPGPDGVVANVRTGEPTAGDVRVVFDLSAKVRPKTYFQNLDGHSQLVIELQGSAGAGKMHPNKPIALAVFPVEPASSPPIAALQESIPGGSPASSAFALSATQSPTVATLGPTGSGTAATANIVHPESIPPAQAVAPTPVVSTRSSVAESHRSEGRVDPSGSQVLAAVPAENDAEAEAPAPAETTTVSRPGARTVRDVLGAGQRKIVIAVDAGHGGQDVGAKGYTGSYEKNVTLATARELARQIDAEPGMHAVLTRDGDYFVPLADRYRKAREAKADLFISIHADADPTHTATGSSVWVLSERGVTSQAANWLADRENAADLIGGVSLSDKDGTLASVLLDLSQSATMKASEDAAERVHQALRDIGRTHKAHPERANFVVLRSPDVPSMLVETAFITNSEEERHLNDSEYRARLAAAVLSGVRSYFIDNPLPGTEFASLHERGSRNARVIAERSTPRMVATSLHSDQEASVESAKAPQNNAPAQLATAADSQQFHVVQRGERLLDIANEYGVSLLRLREANDLQGNDVHPGQQLRIPGRWKSG